MPDEDYGQNGVTEQMFVLFMSKLCGELKPAPTSVERVGADVGGEEVYLLKYHHSKGDGIVSIRLYHGKKGWKVSINSLPIQLAMREHTPTEGWQRLAEAMDSAGIAKLTLFESKDFTTSKRIREMVGGTRRPEALWVRDPF